MKKKILIAGATGLIGVRLCETLYRQGYSIIAATTRKNIPGIISNYCEDYIFWDKGYNISNPKKLIGVDAVINLAGANVAAKRWNDDYKKLILESRTLPNKSLFDAFKSIEYFPKTFIGASATGYYGSRANEELTESSKKGDGFLSDVCREWEDSAKLFSQAGVKTVCIRTGIILSTQGGALPKMILPYKLFAGGTLGKGSQWFPWISLPDILSIICYLLENSKEGTYNCTAPVPVTMSTISKAVASALHRPNLFTVPEWVLKLVLGESAIEITKSQKVVPSRLISEGFQFKHSLLEQSIKDIILNKW